MRIVIDGYNAINQIPSLKRYFPDQLEKARAEFAEMLRPFKKARGHAITVVYDGPGGMWGKGESSVSAGIREMFAPAGKQADDVIMSMARKAPESLIVVSADRRVGDACRKAGAAVMNPQEFEATVMEAILMEGKGGEKEPDRSEFRDRDKKGPAKRLSKQKRKEIRMKKKL